MVEKFYNNFDFKIQEFSPVKFNLNDQFKTRYIKPPKTIEVEEQFLTYANAQKLANDITISINDRYFVVVNGSFIFGDFIEALILKYNYLVTEMVISTLSLSENNVDSLANLLDAGYIQKLDLIVSDYFFAHERHDLVKYLYEKLDKENRFQLAAAGTHCKICLLKTACGKHIVIHGSANLRSSSNIEQIVIEDNQALYDFNNQYQQSIIKQFKTINKSIRGKELWEAVQVNTAG